MRKGFTQGREGNITQRRNDANKRVLTLRRRAVACTFSLRLTARQALRLREKLQKLLFTPFFLHFLCSYLCCSLKIVAECYTLQNNILINEN